MISAEEACSPRLIDTLIYKVHRHLGMDFSGARRADLLRRLSQLAQGPYERWLEELAFAEWDTAVVQSLVPVFSVGETYFRRDASAFEWLARNHLPPLLMQRRHDECRRLRLWSAACCTGEEAYGLLFLVDGLLGAERSSWEVDLLATDINERFLAKAREGLYGRNSFRGDDEAFRDRYFERHGGRWQIRAPWAGHIRFERFNLITEHQEAAMQGADVILCRNVLMYFSPAQARSALRRLLGSLAPQGVLLVSSVEAGIATEAGLQGIHAGSNYALRPSAAEVRGGRLISPGIALARPQPPRSWQQRRPPPSEAITRSVAIKASATIATSHPSRVEASGRPAEQRATVGLSIHELEAYLTGPALDTAQRHHACLLLARHWADRHDFKQAREWLDGALDLDSREPLTYWLLALLEDQSGRLEAALRALQKVLYLDPEFIVAYLLQARLLKAKGRLRASAKAWQECRRLLQSLPEEAEVEHADGLSASSLLGICNSLEGREVLCRTT